jgi:hypothetical protein
MAAEGIGFIGASCAWENLSIAAAQNKAKGVPLRKSPNLPNFKITP